MALIQCPDCSINVSDKAASCPSCGYPIAQRVGHAEVAASYAQQAEPVMATRVVSSPKARGTHIILGILFGGWGFHNFYAGYYLRGGIKFGIFLVAFILDASTGFRTGFSLVALVAFVLWSLIEVIAVDEDASGNRMT